MIDRVDAHLSPRWLRFRRLRIHIKITSKEEWEPELGDVSIQDEGTGEPGSCLFERGLTEERAGDVGG